MRCAGVSIRQDADGRFSLNDLHKAAGGEKRHQPSDWMEGQQAQGLSAELEKLTPGIPGIKKSAGRYGGTFVAKELVYSYAMWISPTFELKVIRAYDAMVTGGIAPALGYVDHVNAIKQWQRIARGRRFTAPLKLKVGHKMCVSSQSRT